MRSGCTAHCNRAVSFYISCAVSHFRNLVIDCNSDDVLYSMRKNLICQVVIVYHPCFLAFFEPFKSSYDFLSILFSLSLSCPSVSLSKHDDILLVLFHTYNSILPLCVLHTSSPLWYRLLPKLALWTLMT